MITAAANGTDIVAIAVSATATAVVLVLLAAALYLLRAARELRRQADALKREARLLLDDLDGAIGQAGAEVARVERLVGSAEAISEALGSASRLVGGVASEPLIKALALGTGLAQTWRSFRGRRYQHVVALAPARRPWRAAPARAGDRQSGRPTRGLPAPEVSTATPRGLRASRAHRGAS